MKIDFEVDVSVSQEAKKDGQISVKLPKADEIRFKMQKAKYDKQLNEWARLLILQLLDNLEAKDQLSAS